MIFDDYYLAIFGLSRKLKSAKQAGKNKLAGQYVSIAIGASGSLMLINYVKRTKQII